MHFPWIIPCLWFCTCPPSIFFLYEGKFFSIFIYPWRYDMTTNLFLCSHRQPTIDNVDRQVSCRYMEKFPIGKIIRGYLIGARCTISKREVFLLRRSHSSTLLYWARICKPFNEPKYRFPAWWAGTTTLPYFSYRIARLHRLAESIPLNPFQGLLKGTQDWEFFWLRLWKLRYFFVSYA